MHKIKEEREPNVADVVRETRSDYSRLKLKLKLFTKSFAKHRLNVVQLHYLVHFQPASMFDF